MMKGMGEKPQYFFPLYLRPASLIEGEEFFFFSEASRERINGIKKY